jgi:hypothetical protein
MRGLTKEPSAGLGTFVGTMPEKTMDPGLSELLVA